jgi:peptidoglycan hydrolase-like protein with peptidoglycan-binding domain
LRLRQRKLVGLLVLVAVGLWIRPGGVCAAESAKGSKKTTSKKVTKSAAHHKSSTRRRASRRRSSYRYRLARLQPEPSRIEEIQQALIREGYLKQEASGKWDDATRSAMRSYQQANGFAVTGLPEAKALMKLGLGPHPLPEDVDPTIAGRASISSPAKTDTPAPEENGPEPDPQNNH